LALILRSLVKQRLSFGWRRLDHFGVLYLLHAPAQCFTEDRPTPIDLVQAGIAAALGDGGQAIDPLDSQTFGRYSSAHRSQIDYLCDQRIRRRKAA